MAKAKRMLLFRALLARVLPATLVALATGIAFVGAIDGRLVWDDVEFLVDTSSYRGLTGESLEWMFTSTYGHYQPLTWLSLSIDDALAQGGSQVPDKQFPDWPDAFGFRRTNVLIHIANALLVYALASTLLGCRASQRRKSRQRRRWASAVAALVFALHPMRVESVAWAVERRNLLATLWLLAAMLSYLAAVRRGGALRWIATGLFFALSLLSRAGGVVFPVLMLILDVYPLGRHRHVSWRRLVLEKLPFVALAIPFAAIAIRAQRESGALVSWTDHTAAERIGQAMYGVAFYPAATLVPMRLSPLYPLPSDLVPLDARHLGAGLAAAALTAVAIRLRRRRPAILAAWACYLVAIGPLLGWAQVGPHEVAARYGYAACLPFAVLVGGAVYELSRRPRRAWSRWMFAGACSAALIGLAYAAQDQIDVWHDDVALWTRVVELYPDSAYAHEHLGFAMSLVLEVDPDADESATSRRSQSDPATIIAHYQRAIELEPTYASAWINLGMMLGGTKRLAEANDAFERGLRDAKRDVERSTAHFGLALLEHRAERPDSAIAHLDQAIALSPQRLAKKLFFRGEAYRARYANHGRNQSDCNHALADYAAAIANRPVFFRARFMTAVLLLGQKRPELLPEAERQLRMVVAGQPHLDKAWMVLADCLIRQGRRAEARQVLGTALDSVPSAAKPAIIRLIQVISAEPEAAGSGSRGRRR